MSKLVRQRLITLSRAAKVLYASFRTSAAAQNRQLVEREQKVTQSLSHMTQNKRNIF